MLNANKHTKAKPKAKPWLIFKSVHMCWHCRTVGGGVNNRSSESRWVPETHLTWQTAMTMLRVMQMTPIHEPMIAPSRRSDKTRLSPAVVTTVSQACTHTHGVSSHRRVSSSAVLSVSIQSNPRPQRSHDHCPVVQIVVVLGACHFACTALTRVALKLSTVCWQRDRHDAGASGPPLNSFGNISQVTHTHVHTHTHTHTHARAWSYQWTWVKVKYSL